MSQQRLSLALLLLTALLAGGCGIDSSSEFFSEDRKQNGLVIILPGIEGESGFNHNIRRGLQAAGCFRAMPIYSWGVPVPIIGMAINQTNPIGNRLAGERIAAMIEDYQDTYPGRPVYVVGHSGGGGVAVFTAEKMSEGRQIDGLVLLAASISNGYDLTKALGKTKNGIVNFYNESDAGLLGLGTTLLSNVDGAKGPSAGLTGFTQSYPCLYQISVTDDMTRASGGGSHDAATRPGFVSRYVAPYVLSSQWPPNQELLSLR